MERKIFGQAIKDARRNGNVFCKSSGASKLGAGNSQDLAVVAQIHVSATAVAAGSTENGRVERDSVAFRKSTYAHSHSGDCSGGFVSHYNGRDAPAGGTIVAVNVAAADSASGYSYEHLAVARRRVRKISNFQVLVFRKQKSFHGSNGSFFKARHPVSTE
jgi:hypothetical protein